MNKDVSVAIRELCREVETTAGRKLVTPKDFVFLENEILDKLHEQISATTLKRLWGYLSEDVTPRVTTLNILAKTPASTRYALPL
jgi:hypothetical protein